MENKTAYSDHQKERIFKKELRYRSRPTGVKVKKLAMKKLEQSHQATSKGCTRERRLPAKQPRNVIWPSRCRAVIILIVLWVPLGFPKSPVKALRITNFRVPAYVPITLPTQASINKQQQLGLNGLGGQHPLNLAKPILFDCDYDYKPEEDARLTVRWFRNKESEPFYQWLPELEVRHLADWIRPLVNQSFISDPLDPMKRYRSLLIKRLSMNLTAHYTCVVSSLANQDTRQASLVVYQPPQTFTFKHSIYPAPAPMPPPPSTRQQQHPPATLFSPQMPPVQHLVGHQVPTGSGIEADQNPAIRPGSSPTQFKGYHYAGPAAAGQVPSAAIVRPPNNNSGGAIQPPPMLQNSTLGSQQQSNLAANTKIIYTHDGRPLRRKSKRQAPAPAPISGWMLRKRLGSVANDGPLASEPKYAIQLHHFQCQATQVTPRPVIVLTVKRGAESIAQYLHESSTTSIRPYQVNHADYFESSPNRSATRTTGPSQFQLTNGNETTDEDGKRQEQLLVTLYDITVSATVALNVSLHPQELGTISGQQKIHLADTLGGSRWEQEQQQQQAGINTVLSFRRGQRMSFECHLEITGTEFEQRKKININEEEVYQFAEAEERKRKLRLQVQQSSGSRELEDNRVQDSDLEAGPSLRFASSFSDPTVHLVAPPIVIILVASTLSLLLTTRLVQERFLHYDETRSN